MSTQSMPKVHDPSILRCPKGNCYCLETDDCVLMSPDSADAERYDYCTYLEAGNLDSAPFLTATHGIVTVWSTPADPDYRKED